MTTEKKTAEDYEPYGHEWEKELMKWSKKALIDWIRKLLSKSKTENDNLL